MLCLLFYVRFKAILSRKKNNNVEQIHSNSFFIMRKSSKSSVKKTVKGAPKPLVENAFIQEWKDALKLKGDDRKDAILHFMLAHYEFKNDKSL